MDQSTQDYPTFTRFSPQTKVRERRGRIETKGGKRHFIPAKVEEKEDTGPFLTPSEKEYLAKINKAKSALHGKPKNKGRYNFHQRAAIKSEVDQRRADKERAERALARKAKGYL